MHTAVSERRPPFLTARWSNLVLVSYAVDPTVLAPLLPPGCELDLVDGNAFVSLVAFDFLDTRVLGVRWPTFVNFPEINLRFYVRHNGSRGVSFIREFVPQRFVATVARLIYNEPYRAARMSSVTRTDDDHITVDHFLQFGGVTHRVKVVAGVEATLPPPHDSVAHFFKEHEWGFGRSRRGRLIRYRVEHPEWHVHAVRSLSLRWDFAAAYGAKWAFLNDATPVSTVLAAGSAIKVFPKG